jgi:hypothetical protein
VDVTPTALAIAGILATLPVRYQAMTHMPWCKRETHPPQVCRLHGSQQDRAG